MQFEITGAGRPIVLVPGGLTGWVSWIPIAEQLALTRKVIRVQLLSVQLGLEGKPLPKGYSPKTEADALGATLHTAGLEPPLDFAGWSYGGGVLADFLLDHPEWARTVTLIEPEAPWLRPALDPATERQREADLKLSRENISEEEMAGFVRRADLVPASVNPRELESWPIMLQHRQSLRAIPTIWEYQGASGRLSRLTAPILLIKGTGSTPNDHAIVEILGRDLPDAEVVELPGGHSAHLVSTAAFLAHMADLHAKT
jgi:pimeloyl-ACP methyl ester carboxylesterase